MFQGLCRLYKRENGFRLGSSTPAKAPSASGVNLEEPFIKITTKQNYEKNNLIAKNPSNQNKGKSATVPVKQEAQKGASGTWTNAQQEQSKKSILGPGEREKSKKIIYSQWVDNEPKQKIIQKFWAKNPDLDMIATFLAENNQLSVDRKSKTNKNGTYDIGICQFNSYRQKKIIRDKNFYNEDFQIQKCVELWKDGTTFYGYKNRMKFKKYLIFK